MKSSNNIKVLAIFVTSYMLVALVWWAILLQRQNAMINDLLVQSDTHQTLEYSFEKKQTMILGEAVVFGLALIIGIGLIYNSYYQTIKNEKSKSNFLLAVTHELKSPITAISLNLQTLKRSKSVTEQGLDNLNLAESETSRLNSLIENLLHSAKSDFSQIKNLEKVNVDKLILGLLNSTFKNHNIAYNKSEVSHTPQLNRTSLETILKNLIENAIKFSKNSSLVSINTMHKSSTIEIAISDNADIIPKSERANIYSKFYRIGDESTRKTKGVGLGLYIVERLIKELKGRIEIREHEIGNTFVVIIPNA